MKILLLEDDTFFANQIVNIVLGDKKLNIEMHHRHLLSETIDFLAKNQIDLIICDLNVTDSQGLETFIKLHQSYRDTPIIILSGDEDEALALKAVKIGAQDYLMKREVKANLLIRSIQYAIQRKNERLQAEAALKRSAEELRRRNQDLINTNEKLQDEITRRIKVEQALKASEEELRLIFDNSPDTFIRVDADKNVLYSNKINIEIINKHLSHNLEKLFEEANSLEFQNALDSVIKDRKIISIETFLEKSKRWHNIRFIPIEINNEFDSAIIISADITEEKQNEIKLKELNATKDKFFSIIAHDLRNPLGSMLSMTEFLNENYYSFSELEKQDFLSEVSKASKKLFELLENLLIWSKSQRNILTCNQQYADINLLIQNIFELTKIQADNKNIQMINDLPANTFLYFDINMINTLLRNLITNAIKFSHDGGTIRILGKNIIQNNKNMMVISVIDNGIGMSKEIQSKLFRLDVPYTEIGTAGEKGTGLGLILCKEFIDKNGGTIWVESELNKRTTFSFT